MKAFLILILCTTCLACNRTTSSSIADTSVISKDSASVIKTKETSSIPACVQAKIDSIKKLPLRNPPAEIHEYEYKGSKVYMLSAPCCDFFTTVVDANCNYICAPSGGFTGQGDRKCPQFIVDAKELRLVWRDERAK
jgi:hypothetical protein